MTATDKRPALDDAIAAGDVTLINPHGSPRGHILANREMRCARNRIHAGWTFCGKRYRNTLTISRADFNLSACGRCARRFVTVIPEDNV